MEVEPPVFRRDARPTWYSAVVGAFPGEPFPERECLLGQTVSVCYLM